nr:hypothetical protein [Tanacetum cinerariifolium]
GRQNRVQGNKARGATAARNRGAQYRADNIFQANQCDAFDSDVDEAPAAQTMFMANLSFVDPVYDEVGPSYDLTLFEDPQCVTSNNTVNASLTAKLARYKNVPDPAPIRSSDQILPFAAWVPIGKSNFVLDLQKKQKNLIFQISVDILQNTNFFKSFTALASVPVIYIQQESLEITPIDQAHQFVSPSSGDAIMDFVNELGYKEELHFVSRMVEEFVQAIQTLG